jgi:hypothetical protein
VATLGVALHEAWTTSVRRTAGLEADVQSADVRSAAAPRA